MKAINYICIENVGRKQVTGIINSKSDKMLVKKGSYSFPIQPQDVDFHGRSTLVALGNILLSTANYNANDNGFGMLHLHEINCAWVLTKLAIEMKRFPRQYEEIQVETWVEEVGRLSTTRNFSIRDKQGTVIGNAGSHWVMIDMQLRRLKDLETLKGIYDYADNTPSLIEKPIKLIPVEGELFDSFKVKYSDIDINGHTNSVRYIEWICNCFSLDTYREKEIKRFEINYVRELFFGEPVDIFGEELEPDDFRFEIRKGDTVACRARIVWKKKSEP